MAENDYLIIPNDARQDPKSFEILRVWIANNAQHVSLRPGVWDDPAAWGIFLVDLAKHISNSYAHHAGAGSTVILERIKAAWEAEMKSATDDPSGHLE